MQTCRWCQFEFDDGADRCPECGTKVKKSRFETPEENEPALLATVTGTNEKEVVLALLRGEGIYALSEPGSGAYAMEAYMGRNLWIEENIYVARRDLERAKDLLEGYENGEAFDEGGGETKRQDDEQSDVSDATEKWRKRKKAAAIGLIVFAAAVCILLAVIP